MYKIVINYESLTDEEREKVPDTSYKAAVEYLKAKEAAMDRRNKNRLEHPRQVQQSHVHPDSSIPDVSKN